jgi:hypothetical protein
VFDLSVNFRLSVTAANHHWRLPGLASLTLGGGACTDANPRVILTGPMFYMKQDYSEISLVGVFLEGGAHQPPLVA